MAQFDLNVHDVAVSHTTTFARNGAVQQGVRVVFFVGDHGPFTLSYDDRATATTARIKSDIDAQVQQLRDLTIT